MDLTPIRHRYALTCEPHHAFEVFTGSMGQWWHPMYTADSDTFTDVEVQPRQGGSVVEVHTNGDRHVWGEVVDYEPPTRFSYTSNLALEGGDPSLVTAVFTPQAGGGTTFDFEHGGWNESNAAQRDKFNEWPTILDRFVDLAHRGD